MDEKKSTFLFRNLFRGIIWLAAIIAVFILFKRYVDLDYIKWLQPLYENSSLILLIFALSEIIIGIIPPELFMIWALRNGDVSEYIFMVTILSLISYSAGITGYFIGRYLNTTIAYRFIRRKFLSKSERRLNTFGIYLIIVAALTPLPFSGVSMLIGSVKYPVRKFLPFALFRFLRFYVYAWFIWEANIIG